MLSTEARGVARQVVELHVQVFLPLPKLLL